MHFLVLANVLQPLIDVFDAVMRFFHNQVGLSWGLSIIALTVVVRALLVPLTVKQMKSMQSMQKLAPEMKALQEKYKDDKPRQQQELMALYKEHQVNPLASCLPLAAQFPVMISLFYMLRHDLRRDICHQTAKACGDPSVGHPEKFLFVHDITDKATGGVLVALIVLYVGSQLLSGLFMSASVDRNQRIMMLALPFVFTTFILRFPAGLIVYWITTNFWTVGQGVLVRRSLGITSGKPGDDAAADAKPATRANGRPASVAAAVADGDGEPQSPAVPKPRREAAPPPPPRRKKKRSGRRR